MSEENLQLALKDLINKSRRKYSIKEVLKEFKAAPANRPQKCTSILKDLVELNVLAKPAYTEYCTNVKKLLPYECLKIFLSSYALVSGISSVAATESNDSVEVNKSVPVDDCTLPIADAVLAIKQRISQAASNGVSKSAQFSALFGDNKNCSYSLSATLMMPAKYIDDMKRTDLWLFHVPNNVCIKQNEILALPAMYQEQIVIKELLYCLIGIRGDYIEPIVADGQSPTGLKPLQFKVSNKINSSVCDIAEKILPLANYYYLIQKFILHVRSHDCGQILQALGAAMNQNLQEYYHAIVYLESNKSALNLHELLYILRPIMQAMEVLADIVMEIWESDKFGGAVLSLLIDRIATLTGNDATQQLVVMLTESAAEPYVEMLKLWMLKGVIVGGESGKEFMIEQNDTDDNTDAYWDKCYTLRPNNIPRFLENDAQMILKTGKYLNVIRECGIDMANFMNSFNPALVKFRFSPTNNQHLSFIRQTHRKVSVTLLNLMMQKKDLMGHLTAARRYFLMGQGDIVQQFMDTSEDELMRDVNLTRPMVLETLLGLTLRTSSAKDDPYLNNLHIEIHSYELCEQLTRIQSFNWRDPLSPDKKLDVNAVECFGFHYNVNWPVSLVLSHQTLTQYQMIFRLLFNVKHVERQLCKVWIANKNVFKVAHKYDGQYQNVFSLRQRMLFAIQNIEAYMTIEVIEPYWQKLTEKLKTVESFDELLDVHSNFIHALIIDCLLKNSFMLHNLMSLCRVSSKFCKHVIDDANAEPTAAYFERIADFDDTFTKLMHNIMQELTRMSAQDESDLVINLAHRLNFNSFFGQHFGKDGFSTNSTKIGDGKQR